MTVPILSTVSPELGPTGGGEVVRLTGSGFASRVAVRLGDQPTQVLSVWEEAGVSVADLRTPAHADAVVDVHLQNLDAAGAPISGEEVLLPNAYRYRRPRLARQSDLTRLVRALLRKLKRQIIASTSITVSVDFHDAETGDLELVTVAQLPSLALSGPRVSENRFYALNEGRQDMVPGPAGPELARHRPTYTVDLAFTITAVSDSTVELLNLMAAVGTFLSRNRWIEMARDPDDPSRGSARWEMDPDGDFRTRLDGPDDIRAFSCGLVIRGFDLDEGQTLDRGKAVDDVEVGAEPIERNVQ
jgi:IPT/TIG domain